VIQELAKNLKQLIFDKVRVSLSPNGLSLLMFLKLVHIRQLLMGLLARTEWEATIAATTSPSLLTLSVSG
jgi:hypothetical protein